ncbi:hypothetical protein QYE76_032766 [Lolium multiflorum]|uniref:CCHC-type domain-containing protein n=1 Tax=Lolium multiflorum TaxID=4521 RepID=A0AAD8VLP7_LOLMU|nr:hypothetical protein QYE76_032766 [Lolium multiflorum]
MRNLLLLKALDVVLVVVFHVELIAVLLKLEPAVFLHSRKTMVWHARVRESLEMTLQQFLNGLKFNIKGIMRHHSYTTMNELLHHAREAESQLAEEAQQRGRATGAGRYTPRPPPSTAPSTRPTDVPSSSSKPVSNVSNTKKPVPAASGTGSNMSTARNRDMVCHTCGGKGHFKKDCPNRKVMIINEDNEYETGDDADPDAPEDDDYDSDSFDAYPSEAQTIVVSQRVLNVQPSASTQRCNLFQTKALVGPDKACKIHVKTNELIEKKGKRNAARKNKKRKEILFKPGDMVWVHFRKDRFPKLRKSKLLPRGAGPYKVLAKINDNAYSIDLPDDEFGVINSFNVADLTPYDGEDLGASRSTPFEGGGDDEDIPTSLLPPSLQDEDEAIVKLKSNEVRIGHMTRARAKLLKKQVNLFLSDTLIDENFILPKSYYLCMMRYEEPSIARGGEEQLDKKLDMKLDMELDVKTSHGRVREEREACARGGHLQAAQGGRPWHRAIRSQPRSAGSHAG